MAANASLIELIGVWREFINGEQTVAALRNVSLKIDAGEMVAIMGASGSGKSTLMNLLGCLDRPSRGEYRIVGQPVRDFDHDALARLRRERFGFIFQRYHLLADLAASENVELPAIYADRLPEQRRQRALLLLERLGLQDRAHHKPNELSGGQQQRVSIGRALMNGGQIVLADEPTGALDSHTGEEVLQILKELHADGHTVVLVTHDSKVAAHANRIIELADGQIVDDRVVTQQAAAPSAAPHTVPERIATADSDAARTRPSLRGTWGRMMQAARMAVLALATHRLRTALTMLGIVIGVASVVTVLAVGEGSRRKVLEQIGSLGTNSIEIWAGRGWGDENAEQAVGLRPEDAQALARQPYLAGASPIVEGGMTVRYGNVSATAELTGVSEDYFDISGITIASGAAFDADSVRRRAQDVVIDPAGQKTLFPGGVDPIGKIIMLGAVPMRVIGVAAPSAALERWGGGKNIQILVPYTTMIDRITGNPRVDSIKVRVADSASPGAAEHAVTHLLKLRRGTDDVYVENASGVRQATEASSATLTLLISTIALISLLVGGIGVMNIMLVSVSERTREIGVRMAIGARRADILQQFLIEAVLVCLAGGVAGICVSFVAGWLLQTFSRDYQVVYSVGAIVIAFVTSVVIGLVFGYLPARNAARLDPVVALARG